MNERKEGMSRGIFTTIDHNGYVYALHMFEIEVDGVFKPMHFFKKIEEDENLDTAVTKPEGYGIDTSGDHPTLVKV